MGERASIAIIILTYNEAKHLPRALNHVSEFAKEIFVIDSFSTDGTADLARARGATVLQRPFKNYADQFAWALANAQITSDWVMRLDADEIVEADLANEIVDELPRLPLDVTGVTLNRKTIFQDRFIRHGGRYPLMLLRIWRRGKAQIEDRWMDEHMYLTEGHSVIFRGGFADHSLIDLTGFTDKHNRYASREALDVLNQRLHLFERPTELTDESTARQAKIKRFLKEKIYNRIPYQMAATAYFLYRYVFQLGFLDGKQGFTYHILQGFWYRFLVGAKLRELEAAVRAARSKEEIRAEIARITRIQLTAD
jgi:glycosyltransferase involved in cell wall biosynthesis